MIIRRARAGEIAALSALASRTYAETFGASMTPAELDAQLRATRSETYFANAMREDTILVAVVNGSIAGYVQLSDVRIPIDGVEAGDQELFALYVDSTAQGRGLGRALLTAAFDEARFKNAPKVYLDVFEENERAIALYRKFGFEPAGWRDFTVDGKVVGRDLVMVRRR